MKCSFCGKELTEGAEFCPECGMILSLGGVTNEPEDKVEAEVELEVPEYTPNVFRAMDFEEEPVVPAMELEVTDTEEIAVVVEAIPEYADEDAENEAAAEEIAEDAAEVEAPVEEEVAQEVEEETFDVPEYDPNAAVSDEFLQQVAEKEQTEAEAEETEAAVEEIEAEEGDSADEAVSEEIEFAPPEYEGNVVEVSLPEEESAADEAEEEPEAAPVQAEPEAEEGTYPAYNIEENESVPEENPTEDESLFAALFESDEGEKIEDITPTDEKPVKTGKNSFVSVAVLIVVLVGVVFAGVYAFKNVLPKVMDRDKLTTTSASTEDVGATTKAPEKTTKADKTTTEKGTAEKTTAEKQTTTKETTTKETTTKETTTKETTTKETTTKETTTKAPETTTDSAEPVVVEPSSYNVDEVPFFPIEGDISIKAGPSSTSANMITHPYGYPVYAYAKEGNYYYVHSPYLDYMGWVYAKDVYEYSEEATTAAAEQEEAPAGEGDVSYIAMINSAEGLNFRTGPGYDYGAEVVVPGGFYVRVSAVSEENPGWVYVTVEDDRYPYGNPSGWVLEEYLV